MGHRSVVVVMHDRLHEIESDPNMGQELAHAIRQFHRPPEMRQRGFSGFEVISSEHADAQEILIVDGYNGEQVYATWNAPVYGSSKTEEEMLRAWADKMGFYLRKKPSKK